MKTFKSLLVISSLFMLSGCAGIMPLPGGKDTINHAFYKTDIDLKSRIASLEEGMPRDEVFAFLERHEDDFILLSREEIVTNLYGGQPIAGVQSVSSPIYSRETLQALTGYKLMFKKVKRKHGVSSPIAMRTNETGYSYTAIFIFKNDELYEKPVLSGGAVDTSSTKTLFDYISPRTIMSQAGI